MSFSASDKILLKLVPSELLVAQVTKFSLSYFQIYYNIILHYIHAASKSGVSKAAISQDVPQSPSKQHPIILRIIVPSECQDLLSQ